MEIITELYQQLEKELIDIELTESNIIEKSKVSFQACEKAMMKLKTFLTAYTFKNAVEEIYFFKELKPKFYSKLIYYVKLFEIETKKPEGSVHAQRKYVKKLLAGIKHYSQDNITFYKYYRSGAVYMDGVYFTRDKFDIQIGFDISYFDCDQSFCSNHDYTVATLLANEQLVVLLNKRLLWLDNRQPDSKTSILEEAGLTWGDTKVALIELIYGLQTVGVLYNAKTKTTADVSQVARFFEAVFNIDLGGYYRTFQEIRIRKKGRTAFMDRITRGLIQRMDDTDENPRQ